MAGLTRPTLLSVTPTLKIQGVDSELRNDIITAEIVNAMYAFPTCRITFARIIQATGSPLGAEDYLEHIGETLELEFKGSDDSTVKFKGEVTGVSFDEEAGSEGRVIMEGRSLYHRMDGASRIRFFDEMKMQDAVNQVLGDNGRPSGQFSDAPSETVRQIVQLNESDWDFLMRMARENGLFLWVDDDKVHMAKASRTSSVTANIATDMRTYSARSTVAPFKFKSQKSDYLSGQNAIVAGDSTSLSGGGVGFSEVQDASDDMFQQGQIIDGRWMQDQATIQRLVENETKSSGASMVLALGETQIRDVKVACTIDAQGGHGLGQEIFATSVIHRFTQAGGYGNVFHGIPLQAAHAPSPRRVRRAPQFFTAKVTNNVDEEENLGRVKVIFHHDDTQTESPFLRVLQPLAGPNHGTYWLPQVDDEVLVGFHFGQNDDPVVLGSLYAKDNEITGADFITNSQTFVFVTPAQNRFGMWDDFDGNKVISLALPSSDVMITMSEDNPKEIGIKAVDGTIKLIAKEIEIKGEDKITLETKELAMNGSSGFGADSGGNLKIKASGNIDIEAGGNVNVKGAMINLN